jgi:hypothetical protein
MCVPRYLLGTIPAFSTAQSSGYTTTLLNRSYSYVTTNQNIFRAQIWESLV